MIHSLTIRGLKRFKEQSFVVQPLTVLAGLNGAGKTSVIHALLLAREASTTNLERTVQLNGPFGLELGSAGDVRNWAVESDIEVVLSHGVGEAEVATFSFGVPTEEALYLTLRDLPSSRPRAFTNTPRAFSYLCAERLGPRNAVAASALPTRALEVGVRGEHCAQVLAAQSDRPLEDTARRHPTAEGDAGQLLKYEVERWLAEIVRPVELDIEALSGGTLHALRYRTPGGDWVRAPNMGFGVSYALPIIVAGLVAAAGGLLIVENPEAHLHPAGQSRMGVFLAWLAGRGVQVLVETHSDHVLNGIRRAIGELHYLDQTKACAHFFEGRDDAVVHALRFSATGGVSHWPQGFFDQYPIDVEALGRVRRNQQ